MKLLFTPFLSLFFVSCLWAQNINYSARITSFYGSNCGGEPFNEEHTWKGWLSDNANTTEVYSGCITRNHNGAVTQYGTYANYTRNNIAATQLRTRIDAWEDDSRGRCDYNTGTFINNDDCRANRTCTFNFYNPLEYQPTSRTVNCGTGDYNMNVFHTYRYATTNLNNATENTTVTYTTSGTRPFWGSRGNWASVGSDCATSGTITHNQTSSFRTTVTCKRQVRFRWRVSSEANFDFLEVYVNGVRRQRISGNVGWTTVTLNLGFGNNTVEWRYDKDGSVTSGLDRGFVDQVEFIDATTIVPGTIGGNQTLCSGGNPSNIGSTATAQAYSNTINYQWQYSNNGVTGWINIGGATGISYNPPAGLTQTRYYRRRVQDNCGNTGYSNNAIRTVNPLPNGNLAGTTSICSGNNTNIVFNSTAGSGPWDVTINGTTYNNINSGSNIPVNPSNTTTYSISNITDNNGCVRSSGLGSSALITVNTLSTAPTIANVSGKQCPNTSLLLSASGGTAGTGSNIRWYSGPNGTGTFLGSGNTLNVSPNSATTYYARREGICNNTTSDAELVDIKDYVYTPVGTTSSVDYCTDDLGWNHFYDAADNIIFSIRGNISGATTAPVVTITNNNTFFQNTLGAVGSCTNGYSPGEEQFEMQRNWNVDFTGTLNPPYDIRYYFPAAEKTAIENAANAFIAANPACGYTYKYPNPNGFIWFKNVGATYVAPQFDLPTQLSGNPGTVNGTNYSEISGITSFSGGAGSVILSPDQDLPVEFVSFEGWHKDNKNILQWVTESELNSASFEVERSIDGSNFERIGTVAAAGNSNVLLTYLFEDKTPMLGVNYYRLRQVDFDGSFTYSNTIAIEVEGDLGTQVIYPNPTNGLVSYQFTTSQATTRYVQVLDILGKEVQNFSIEAQAGINTTNIDLSDYPGGTYLIMVSQGDGQVVLREKVVKE